jgi:CHRD domain
MIVMSRCRKVFRTGFAMAAIAMFAAACSISSDDTADTAAPTAAPSTTIYYASLTGAQENPPVLTAAFGNAIIVVTPSTGAVRVNVTSVGFTGNAAHVHIGDPGINGPVIVPLTETSAGSGVWLSASNATLDATQMAALTAGGLYVNVHSALHPGGQIRGQIGRTVLTTRLTGSQENPPNNSTGGGSGVFSVDPDTRALTARVVSTGGPYTAAHIHIAPIGSNAGVAVGFNETAPGSNIWVPPAGTILTPDQFAAFNSGGMYFNVHSTTFPGGEVRGQIGRDVLDIALTGAQEVPPVVGGGSATSRIVINHVTRELTGTVTNSGIAGSAAHIHAGLFGVNAPVFIPTTQSATNSNVWNFTPTVLTEAQYRAIIFGNMYVNTHSPTYPGGEARAQTANIVRHGLLVGANEVPPNTSTATGRGRAELNPNTLDITCVVTTTGITGSAAHLHLAAAGVNGPIIVPFTEGPVGTWSCPAGAKLTQAQAVAFAAGGTYFNVHSTALPGGEIRAQAALLD